MADDRLCDALRPGAVAVLGEVFVDMLYADLDDDPAPGREVYADRWALEPGGFAITAIALARLGRTARLSALMGDDALAEAILADLRAEGVDTAYVARAPEATSITTAVVYRGDRSFITRLGRRAPEAQAASARAVLAADISHLHLSATHPLADSLLDDAARLGIGVTLAVGWRPEFLRSQTLRDRMARATVVALNAQEAIEASGERAIDAAVDTLATRAPWVLVTLGQEGAVLARGDRRWRAPAATCRAVDTTGAGDVYLAALVDSAMLGMGEDAAMRRAAYVAARAVEHLGGAGGVPRLAEDPALAHNHAWPGA